MFNFSQILSGMQGMPGMEGSPMGVAPPMEMRHGAMTDFAMPAESAPTKPKKGRQQNTPTGKNPPADGGAIGQLGQDPFITAVMGMVRQNFLNQTMAGQMQQPQQFGFGPPQQMPMQAPMQQPMEAPGAFNFGVRNPRNRMV